jgi:hypothetical protein
MPVRTPNTQLSGLTCSPSDDRHRRGSGSRRHHRKHSGNGHNLNRPTKSPSKRAYRTGQPCESDRRGPACTRTQARAKSGSLDGLGPSPGQITNSGQPTEGGPGAQAWRDMGLDCRTRAASPQSVHSSGPAPGPGPTNLESVTGQARPARRVTTVQSRAPARGIAHSPGPHPGSARARAAHQARRTGLGGPGGRTWDQSSSGRPGGLESSPNSPGPAGPPSGQGSQGPAAAGSTAGKDSENSALAGRATTPGPRRVAQSGTGPRYLASQDG